MTTRRQFVQASAGSALLGALGSSPVFAQAFEQVKILYGFPAGSAGDICARRVGDKFGGAAYSKKMALLTPKPGPVAGLRWKPSSLLQRMAPCWP